MHQLYCSPQFLDAILPVPGGRNIRRAINVVHLLNLGFRITQRRSSMELNKGAHDTTQGCTIKPKVTPLQQIIHSSAIGGEGWEKCWEQGVIPWDLKQATPALLHLVQTRALPFGRALVPGCGTGYDVVALACPERYAVGLDISDSAVKKAKEFSSLLPNANHCTFLKEDFFTWQPTELFDLIFDYTFFCAIEPDMRVSWASRMNDLLKPNGELLTIMFPIDDDNVGGPPYKVSVTAYEEVLHPIGFQAVSIVDNKLAIGRREGREKVGRWKRSLCKALL